MRFGWLFLIVFLATSRPVEAQNGAGEFVRKPMVCALGTRDVPADALSYPLAAKESK